MDEKDQQPDNNNDGGEKKERSFLLIHRYEKPVSRNWRLIVERLRPCSSKGAFAKLAIRQEEIRRQAPPEIIYHPLVRTDGFQESQQDRTTCFWLDLGRIPVPCQREVLP